MIVNSAKRQELPVELEIEKVILQSVNGSELEVGESAKKNLFGGPMIGAMEDGDLFGGSHWANRKRGASLGMNEEADVVKI